jgi:hypothetical protein
MLKRVSELTLRVAEFDAAGRGPYGGAAVRGPYGGATVRGPHGGVAVRRPYYRRY